MTDEVTKKEHTVGDLGIFVARGQNPDAAMHSLKCIMCNIRSACGLPITKILCVWSSRQHLGCMFFYGNAGKS